MSLKYEPSSDPLHISAKQMMIIQTLGADLARRGDGDGGGEEAAWKRGWGSASICSDRVTWLTIPCLGPHSIEACYQASIQFSEFRWHSLILNFAGQTEGLKYEPCSEPLHISAK